MRVIGLCGRQRSGKDTVANLIMERFVGTDVPIWRRSFAAPMKEFVGRLFNLTREQLYGDDREKPIEGYTRPDGTPLTTRYALQTLGTEWGRNLDPDLWVKACMNELQQHSAFLQIAIITDVRFLNEAKFIREQGGEVWRIHRPLGHLQADAHASEREIWAPEMDAYVTHELTNDSTLHALTAQVYKLLRRDDTEQV